jgi:hypothetical protein
MLENLLLFRLREERAAAQRAVEGWRSAHATTWPGTPAGRVDWTMHAASLKAMSERCRRDYEEDERMFKELLHSLEHTEDRTALENANVFVQEYSDCTLGIVGAIQSLGSLLHRASGLDDPVDQDSLNEIARGYWKWKEDFPELSVFHWKPTKAGLKKRIEQALAMPRGQGSNWREILGDDDETSNGTQDERR